MFTHIQREMHVRFKKRKGYFFVSVIAAIITFVILLLLAFYWRSDELKNDSRIRVDFAVRYIDTILDGASQAAVELTPLLNSECTQTTIKILRQTLLKYPQIRGFNLSRDNYIYCSSLSETKLRLYHPNLYIDNKIRIYNSNKDERFPLLLLRTASYDRSVITSINFFFISDILSIIHSVPDIYFRVGDVVLSSHGFKVTEREFPENFSHVLSQKFPYELDYHISLESQIFWFWNFAWLIIPVCLLSSITVGWGLLKYLTRQPSLLDALKAGIDNEEFVPYFQPIFCAKTKKITGCEVLMRWNHPLMGIIPPDQFIPLAESSGLIGPMTHHLFGDIKKLFLQHEDFLPDGFHVSINISPGYLSRELQNDCLEFVEALHTRKTMLILEITERLQMDTTPAILDILDTLSSKNIRFALDDFGTGYANHNYLQNFPVDYIKIDKCFVQLANIDKVTDHIVENVVGLARRLDVAIIAEGIETPEQERSMIQKGVNYLQGYLYSRPLSASDFIRFIQ
ncbi:cyclic diguanylate phosphodiesterase [Salmonella enterica subsp. enterica serovar Oslo]|nr:cyclic diguanylate phosphodiesterase [Salmonella enterica subsp. enterica serovar Oslo]